MRRFEVADLLPDDPSAGLCGRSSVRRHEREPRAPKALIDRSERRVPEDEKQSTPIRTTAQAGSVLRSVHSQCLRSLGGKPSLQSANTLSRVARLHKGAPMRPSSLADGQARARQAHGGKWVLIARPSREMSYRRRARPRRSWHGAKAFRTPFPLGAPRGVEGDDVVLPRL
jgi:hypothetical protein